MAIPKWWKRHDGAEFSSGPSSSNVFQKRTVTKGTVVQLQRTFLEGQLTYVTPISAEGQTLSVQVDTGSSDFWLASDRCGTPSCQSKEGYNVVLFRDDFGLDTGEGANVTYLMGSAAGPVVQTNVSFANTVLPMEAVMTAAMVENIELNTMQASGVMGLGLPIDSSIQMALSTATTGNNNSITDTSETGSVLPALWYSAPEGERFFGLGLQRLPSDGGNGNSTITFADYDSSYVNTTEQNKISWAAVVADSDGYIRHWKSYLTSLTLMVNNSQVNIPISMTGAVSAASAVLTSGAPFNYANPSFLNALYGAYNVGPSADGLGTYYVDCQLQIDMTITVGNVQVPIHPLDSSLKINNMDGGNNDGCLGSFQAFPQGMPSDMFNANIILGAPFLRSAYTLYSCDPNPSNKTETGWCSNPWMGIYPLYSNSTGAFKGAQSEFQKVRVQGQVLGDNSQIDGGVQKVSSFSSGAKIAIGVACGLVGILAIMAILLYLLKRRRAQRAPGHFDNNSSSEEEEKDPINGSVDWKKLSENERQKARELAMLHGRFVDDADGRSSPIPPTKGPDDDWDISSKGYWEARAIKNDYLRRQRDSSAAAKSLSTGTTYDGATQVGEIHEMSDPSGSRPASPPLSPYEDGPLTPPKQYEDYHGHAV